MTVEQLIKELEKLNGPVQIDGLGVYLECGCKIRIKLCDGCFTEACEARQGLKRKDQ